MNEMNRVELMPGVFLRTIHTEKFKSAYLSLNMMEMISQETASLNALVPDVLRRGCEGYPDMESLSAALDEMYGGAITPIIRKKGETQCVGFGLSLLDDRFTPDGTKVLEPAAALLGKLLLKPVTEEGVFKASYVDSEKQNLIDEIRSEINDKRSYATQRMVSLMCQGEAYGVDKLGDEESAQAITPQTLWARYQTLLREAEIEIFYCGSAPHDRVEGAMRRALANLPTDRDPQPTDCQICVNARTAEPRVIEESMDVSQGKLAMGFRTGGITAWDEDYPALLMTNAIFGGTAMSKLFMHVRERLSLCYYASSGLERLKGIVLVSSGVEFDKADQAKAEILAQLDCIRGGEIEDWELEGARRILIGGLQSTLDSQSGQDDFWLGQAVAGLDHDIQSVVTQLEQVTADQVVAVAKKLELDTIYFLKGLEG